MDSPILIDVSQQGDVRFDQEFLERLGHPVLVCHGPGEDTLCPLLRDSHCETLESAHGVIFELDLDRAQHRAILSRYLDMLAPGIPIRAVVKPEQRERYADLLRRVRVWERMPTAGELDGFAAEVESQDDATSGA